MGYGIFRKKGDLGRFAFGSTSTGNKLFETKKKAVSVAKKETQIKKIIARRKKRGYYTQSEKRILGLY